MSTEELPLGAEFPPATREHWLRLVDGVLKGAPFERLVTKSHDGLRIEPLYAREPGARPVRARAPATPWQVMQRVDHPDPAAANAEALHDLESGATGLSLVFAGSVGAYGYGLDVAAETIERALDGVRLDAIPLELQLGPRSKDAAGEIAALVRKRGLAPAATDIRFGFDPIGAAAAAGGSTLAWPQIARLFAPLISDLARQGFAGPFAVADARLVHAAGGSQAQELAWALAVAVAYLRALEAGGVALDQARGMIFFRLAADADQLLTIAKFRAARKLWARVEEACGIAPEPAFVAAETAWRMMTKHDPWVNILRATIAAFSAGLGGADAITVLPFTLPLGLPDRFARRIARNTQLILMEESNLARVGDPAAGSGAIEDLTHQLCGVAWALFQEIERAGGAWRALEASLIQDKVAAVRAARQRAIAYGREAFTGTSAFADINERAIAVLAAAPAKVPAPAAATIAPLTQLRLAEPFEALREASDRMLAASGSRPKIFLANLGALAEFSARAGFAKNFFEAGGIEAVTNDGFVAVPSPLEEGGEASAASRAGRGVNTARGDTPLPAASQPTSPTRGEVTIGDGIVTTTDLAALVAAFQSSGARLACICSSDAVYAREAVAAAEALRRAGAHIYLAGRPGEREAALKTAGVASFIYAGCDMLATLQAAHDILALTR